MISKKSLLVVFFLGVAVLLAVFVHNLRARETVVIAMAKQPMLGLIHLADELEYFKKEGISIEYRIYGLGRDAVGDLATNDAQLATLYTTPFVKNVYEGAEITILTTLHNASRDTALVVKQDRGIATPRDLEGRTIALPMGTNMEFFFYSMLAVEGLDIKSVNIVNTSVDDLARALSEPDIDGVVAWGAPLLDITTAYSSDEIGIHYAETYLETSLLVGRSDFIEDNGELVRRFITALVAAEDYAIEHPEHTAEIIASRTNLASQKVVSLMDVFSLSLKIDNRLLASLRSEATLYRQVGVYEGDVPDMADYITTEYLRSVKPTAVTIK